jgi:cytochrome oxidase assembly protein ShyY1
VRAFFINVFMTAVFSALAYWWISRFEKRQARKSAATRRKRAAAPWPASADRHVAKRDGDQGRPFFIGRIRGRRVKICLVLL